MKSISYCHIFVQSSDIYYITARPKKKDPSSMALPEDSYFPCVGFKIFFPHSLGEILRVEGVTSEQFVKAQ